MNYVQGLRKLVGHRPLILNGSCILLFNRQKELLLQKRNEPQRRWGLLGGLMELGESTSDVVIREVKEESGIHLTPKQLQFFKLYSGPEKRSLAPNGDIFYSVISAYVSAPIEALPVISDCESLAFAWFALDQLPQPLVRSHQQIISDYLQHQADTLS